MCIRDRFSISLFMALVSILLVLVYKQPYKKINEESMAQSAAVSYTHLDVYKRQVLGVCREACLMAQDIA